MNRSLNVETGDGLFPWRCRPSADTTVGELELAVSMLKLDILRTTADEILLVQSDQAIKDGVPPPDIQELAMVMFGPDAGEAVLVEESGVWPILEDITVGGHALRPGKLDVTIDLEETSDRHLEEDADREMIGDDVDLGIRNIGNK